VLADAQITVIGQERIEIRFDGLASMQINVVRHLVNNRFQMIESQLDLAPLSIANLSRTDLARLAAIENLGMRGVSVLPIDGEQNNGRAALRIRSGFVGQKGRTVDEIENLAIDVLTTIAFARQLEDRITAHAVAGEFSFELFEARRKARPFVANRFINHGQMIFSGSTDRVFSQICTTLRNDFHFAVKTLSSNTAHVEPPRIQGLSVGKGLEILAKIPSETPIFYCHASLMKLDSTSTENIWLLLADLNSQLESGHFEWNPIDQILSFVSWKHLTNDLRHFSFDYVMFSAAHAYALAMETVENKKRESQQFTATIIPFPSVSTGLSSALKKAA